MALTRDERKELTDIQVTLVEISGKLDSFSTTQNKAEKAYKTLFENGVSSKVEEIYQWMKRLEAEEQAEAKQKQKEEREAKSNTVLEKFKSLLSLRNVVLVYMLQEIVVAYFLK